MHLSQIVHGWLDSKSEPNRTLCVSSSSSFFLSQCIFVVCKKLKWTKLFKFIRNSKSANYWSTTYRFYHFNGANYFLTLMKKSQNQFYWIFLFECKIKSSLNWMNAWLKFFTEKLEIFNQTNAVSAVTESNCLVYLSQFHSRSTLLSEKNHFFSIHIQTMTMNFSLIFQYNFAMITYMVGKINKQMAHNIRHRPQFILSASKFSTSSKSNTNTL